MSEKYTKKAKFMLANRELSVDVTDKTFDAIVNKKIKYFINSSKGRHIVVNINRVDIIEFEDIEEYMG